MTSPDKARLVVMRPPATAIAAVSAGAGLPRFVTRDQATAIVNGARRTMHRLLIQTLWESGGRVSEVLRLRPADVDRHDGALRLVNLKQRRRELRTKVVYVSPELVGALLALARDLRLAPTDYYFRSSSSGLEPMSRQQAWRIIGAAAARAGVRVAGQVPNARDMRHGAAIDQLRAGVPLSEIQQQLGHARVDTTTIYLRLSDAERRAFADRRFAR
jgi:integrase/recombinase XerD